MKRDDIETLMLNRGIEQYSGEPVTHLVHMLQLRRYDDLAKQAHRSTRSWAHYWNIARL